MARLLIASCLLSWMNGSLIHAQGNPAPESVPVPAGTVVTVRTVDPIDSKSGDVGKTYRASLDAPLLVNGVELASKGADVTLKIIESKTAGKLSGKAEIMLTLAEVKGARGPIVIGNTTASVVSKGKGKGSAFKIGGGAAAGAALGGILGGGKGAAIGAGAGAGVGTAAALSSSPRVQLPSESVLTFQVQ